jgi:biopolymer transport protein ExbB
MTRVAAALCLIAWLAAPLAARAEEAPAEPAPAPKPKTLDALLERVQKGWNLETAEDREREAQFRVQREEQERLLQQARAALVAEEKRSEDLEANFQRNELDLARLEEQLTERLGSLGELFGVVRQVAGDARGNIEASLVSAQLPDREHFLGELGQSTGLPSISSLERFWFTLHQEMTEIGKVVRFPATVVTVDGDEVEREVIRVGAFNVIADGRYLTWEPEVGKLSELARQPAGIYLSTVSSFEAASEGTERFAIDPSRGSILSVLVQTPSAGERIEQGGLVGYTIIALGILGGLVALARWAAVVASARRVSAQRGRSEVRQDNALGRVLSVYEENRSVDPETLELKLDEAIMRESSRLGRFLWAIKVVSVVAPLLGLLGTVTGMIRTFQAITLFGTGDPKMMASGISEALVTTMLGLTVAIPLVLLHAVVSSGSRSVVEVLEEQAAGMVARRAERRDAVA